MMLCWKVYIGLLLYIYAASGCSSLAVSRLFVSLFQWTPCSPFVLFSSVLNKILFLIKEKIEQVLAAFLPFIGPQASD